MNPVLTPLQRTIHPQAINALRIKKTLAYLLKSILILLIGSIFFVSCRQDTYSIQGTYRIYSEDPMVKLFIAGQDTYIRIQDDGKIIYNTTINQKPKFHNEGTYTLDEKTNTLEIKWDSGKLPTKLTVEKEKEDYLIRIGETIYKKEKIIS